MTAFVVAHRDEFGLEPIFRELQVAREAMVLAHERRVVRLVDP